jgi:leucyl aminopeptidase
MKISIFAVSCIILAVIGIVAAKEGLSDFHTKPIQARFDENTVVWTTHAQARQIARDLGHKGVGYIDVTDRDVPNHKQIARNFPSQPSQQALVTPLLAQMKASNLLAYDTKLSSFQNRYYTSDSGVAAATWIKQQFEKFAAGRKDIDVKFFSHAWAQPSVIATIKGNGPLANEIVIVGAHEDSINERGNPETNVAPGADDDGSGVVNVLEIFRTLVSSGQTFNRTIQFMTYSAEEVGLKGSADIANYYKQNNIPVTGVYHVEMSGYVAPGNEKQITILEDYVNKPLTNFLKVLTQTYTSLPYTTDTCGYACSDHASWYAVGYPDVCTAEAGPNGEVNPYMHTDQDTVDKLDMSYSLEFAKLALSFAIELSQYQGN